MAVRILLVDDEDILREALAQLLEMAGYEVEQASTACEAVDLAAAGFDVFLVDVRLGSESGVDLVRSLLEISPNSGVVLMSGGEQASDLPQGLCWVGKPFDFDFLVVEIERARRSPR